MNTFKIIPLFILCVANLVFCDAVICSKPRKMWFNAMQVGDGIAHYASAKILSLKYKLPFYYSEFDHHDLFVLSDNDNLDVDSSVLASGRKIKKIEDEDAIKQDRQSDVIFLPHIKTKIKYIKPEWLEELKRNIKLKSIPEVFELPQKIITVAVSIRKGNGGGAVYDGEHLSLQEFDFDRTKVVYHTDFENYPFDWPMYRRKKGYFIKEELERHSRKRNACNKGESTCFIDNFIGLQKRFPPNQYYVDQIQKLSTQLHDCPLFVQICTDDKDPESLVERIKTMVNKSNIIFYYDDNRHLPFKDRIHQDLYMLSRTDVLIRSESGFARVAELLGNHRMVIYPLRCYWEDNKLIMNEIVVKGSIKELLNNK